MKKSRLTQVQYAYSEEEAMTQVSRLFPLHDDKWGLFCVKQDVWSVVVRSVTISFWLGWGILGQVTRACCITFLPFTVFKRKTHLPSRCGLGIALPEIHYLNVSQNSLWFCTLLTWRYILIFKKLPVLSFPGHFVNDMQVIRQNYDWWIKFGRSGKAEIKLLAVKAQYINMCHY